MPRGLANNTEILFHSDSRITEIIVQLMRTRNHMFDYSLDSAVGDGPSTLTRFTSDESKGRASACVERAPELSERTENWRDLKLRVVRYKWKQRINQLVPRMILSTWRNFQERTRGLSVKGVKNLSIMDYHEDGLK